MDSASSPHRRTLIPPLSGDDLLVPGQQFPREELLRRVLSLFWRECCWPLGCSQAPAPVIEFAGELPGRADRRLRVWWLLNDGILEDGEGPHSERVRLFFDGVGRIGQLWPRYEFRVSEDPFEVAMGFYEEPTGRGHRARLELQADGRVRVLGQEPWWGE